MNSEQIIYLLLGLTWFVFSNWRKSKQNDKSKNYTEFEELLKNSKNIKPNIFETKDNKLFSNRSSNAQTKSMVNNLSPKTSKSIILSKENEEIEEKFDLKKAIVYQTIMNRYDA
jgi:hypothetical protein